MQPSQKLFPLFAVALCGIGLVIFVGAALLKTDGFLVYTLDDPYIHLALADSILKGGYGINEGEYASPSSSILYPFLLAGALALGLGTYGPLVISGTFAILSVWVLSRYAARVLPEDEGLLSWVTYFAMGLAIVFGLNAIGLPMTGMEHTIHTFGVVLTLTALYKLLVDDYENQIWVIFLGCLICATVRFEGMALVAGVTIALFLGGYRRSAIALIALVGAVLAIYASYMMSLGLPLFPSSVMTKSDVAANASEGSIFLVARDLISNSIAAVLSDRGVVMGIVAAITFACLLDANSFKGLRLFFLSILVLLVGHLMAGRFGWFSRYEIYAVAAMLVVSVTLLKHYGTGRVFSSLAVAMAALVYAVPYGLTTKRSPAASANIYQQQYQMHRFAQDYFPAPVAVNDLGWVAYENQNYVLDLWGLGSEEARQLTAAGGWSKEKLAEITQRNSIQFAMIYDTWFDEVPDEWCVAGKLITSRVTADSDTVTIYLIDLDQADQFRSALVTFEESLPEGARLQIGTC